MFDEAEWGGDKENLVLAWRYSKIMLLLLMYGLVVLRTGRNDSLLYLHMMKKVFALFAFSLLCSLSYGYSLQRFINIYKEKDGARCKVLNRDSRFNDVPDDAFSPLSMKLRSGSLKVMGIEKMVTLQLDSCREEVRESFVDGVYDVIPMDYSWLTEKGGYSIYMSNSDEEYAVTLIIDQCTHEAIGHIHQRESRLLVVNDKHIGIDSDKFGRYLEQGAEKLGESMYEAGEKIKGGLQRLQERAKEWQEESENEGLYLF